MRERAKSLPRITPDSEPFWNVLRERKLILSYCSDCGESHLPPGPMCPGCFSDERLAVGLAVAIDFGEVREGITLPRFRPAAV